MIEKILNEVNSKLKDRPLIYFCKEAEKAIGLENILTNYHICCIEDSSLVDSLIKKGISIFCLEKAGVKLQDKTTSQLISNPATLNWLSNITNGGEKFYALTFLPTESIKFKLDKLKGELLNNPYEFYKKFENKLTQVETFTQAKVNFPNTKIIDAVNLNYEELNSSFNGNFIIQSERAHTGSGTYFIKNREDLLNVQKILNGNKVKVVKELAGIPLTLNVLINKDLFISSLQYQITGIDVLTNNKGTTVGNDFSFGSQMIEKSDGGFIDKLKKGIGSIGQILKDSGYKGIFGLDFIYSNNELYFIEINARQTANIPFQTKLELINNQVPLMLMHIATFLGIGLDSNEYTHLKQLEGAQIFLRAKNDNTVIQNELKSGVYRLQSDNEAYDSGEVKDNVIFIDEEQDKPLIFQSEGYSIEDINGGFLFLCQRKGDIENKTDEICRMQFKNGITMNGVVLPWIIEAMKSIEKLIINS